MKTLKQLAQDAIDVQSACNLSGVVHGFSRAITDLREALSAEGISSTEAINTHPIAVMWADKVGTLTCCMSGFSKSYEAVKELAGK